jgi:hypothetical protein
MSELNNTSLNECCIHYETHGENIFLKIQYKINLLPEEKQSQIHLLKNKEVILWIYGITTFLDPVNEIKSYRKKVIKEFIGYKKKKKKIENGFYKNGKQKYKIIHEDDESIPKYKNIKVDDEDKPIFEYNKGQLLEKRRENEGKWNMGLMKDIRPDLFNKEHSQSSLFGLFGEILVKEYYILTGEFKTDKPEKLGGHDLDLETFEKMIEVKTGSYFTTGTAGEKIFGVPYKYRKVPRLYNKPLLIILLGGDKKDSELVCETDDLENKIHKDFWKSQNITFTCFRKLLNNL